MLNMMITDIKPAKKQRTSKQIVKAITAVALVVAWLSTEALDSEFYVISTIGLAVSMIWLVLFIIAQHPRFSDRYYKKEM